MFLWLLDAIGQETYLRIVNPEEDGETEFTAPDNAVFCGAQVCIELFSRSSIYLKCNFLLQIVINQLFSWLSGHKSTHLQQCQFPEKAWGSCWFLWHSLLYRFILKWKLGCENSFFGTFVGYLHLWCAKWVNLSINFVILFRLFSSTKDL